MIPFVLLVLARLIDFTHLLRIPLIILLWNLSFVIFGVLHPNLPLRDLVITYPLWMLFLNSPEFIFSSPRLRHSMFLSNLKL